MSVPHAGDGKLGPSPNGNGTRPSGLDDDGVGYDASAATPASGAPALSEDEQIAALELEYGFPGYIPLVVVAHKTEVFETMLDAKLQEVQGTDPYRRRDRLSRHGTYVSYRLELFVPDARAAIARRTAIAALPGIKMLL